MPAIVILNNYRAELWFPSAATRRPGMVKGCHEDHRLHIFCETRWSEVGARSVCCGDFDEDCQSEESNNQGPLHRGVKGCVRP